MLVQIPKRKILRKSLRPKKSHFWGTPVNPLIFGSFFPLTFRINCTFFSNSYFPQKTSYVNDWQNQNKLILPQFHFWGKLTKSLDFWEFFSHNFKNNCSFFFKLVFSQENSYFNNWQNQNKLTLPQFHFWGKLTKSSDFWEFFPPNFQNTCTFFCKLLFSQDKFIL